MDIITNGFSMYINPWAFTAVFLLFVVFWIVITKQILDFIEYNEEMKGE